MSTRFKSYTKLVERGYLPTGRLDAAFFAAILSKRKRCNSERRKLQILQQLDDLIKCNHR
jgi:hypothetical protein